MRLIGGVASSDATDGELLSAHIAGDTAAFAVLFRRHQDHLWLTARRASYSAEDAADSLQEAMLSAHRTAGAFRADAAVRSWLHRIVVNACLDRIRRNKVRPTVPLGEEAREPRDPTDRYADIDLSIVVEKALFSLPPEQRAAIVAVDMEGYSVADAAAALGVPTGTIKSRCARGRQKLALVLQSVRADDTDL
ncbi:RNA polymerase subunit sigma [Rhodococcus sp. Leaf7]|uniref:RNA polymerase sigma factor SigM n=1 Tax=unclassified Rhodococcus (in: high G+C Gram-positive bacteria) TaxID=192944 RepID=UPI0005AC5FF7|nr:MULTISPECIES: RNA polymerase sigma factor SigM [unclassified Rhodococcus (in: high G+C Gram-positive bacteria)]KIQ19350.1 RNA polymerase sigma factor SigM [Rhodococcus sp. MEB064]KQU04576.1 RNA polymerase subunit sigma [Rhodococcus sp. Leaf7]KQU40762.1 RNA polymerase subunit sigma [Rhodococcus sp. Leaf247]